MLTLSPDAKKFTPLVCILLLASLMTASASDSTPNSQIDIAETGRPPVRLFTDNDGLPQRSITALATDARGYVWAGTQNGLSYYNGRKWTSAQMPNRADARHIRALRATADGALWIGTDGAGLFRLKDGRWTSFDSASGLPSNRVMALIETVLADGRRALWAGTENGIARMVDDRWEIFNTQKGLPANAISCFAPVGERSFRAGTNGSGLLLYEDGRWSAITKDAGLPSNIVYSILEDRAGVLWVGTDAGIARYENGGWTKLDFIGGKQISEVFSLLETVSPDGARTLWAGTNGSGLLKFQNERWRRIDTSTGLLNDVVFCLMETPARLGPPSVWAGTNGGGIARVESEGWISFTTATGLPEKSVTSLLETVEDGAFWIGTYGGGVARFLDGRWSVFDSRSGLPDNSVWVLKETASADGNRAVWAGTDRGLVRYHRGRWTSFNAQTPILDSAINCLLEDSARSLWVGADRGLACFERGRWKTFDTASGLPHNRVMILLETAEGLWAGTRGGGLARSSEGQWVTYNTQNGLPHNFVTSLIETVSGTGSRHLWAGTDGGGLARLGDDGWRVFNIESGMPSNLITQLHLSVSKDRRYLWVGSFGGIVRLDIDSPAAPPLIFSDTTAPALPNNTVYLIREDSEGRIYVYTNKGIARLSALTDSPMEATDYDIYTFTTTDGLPNNECVQGAALIDSFGRVWAGTVEGAAVLDPIAERRIATSKPVYIEQTLIGGRPRTIAADESLAYNENSLVFEFALLNYFRESHTRFKTQMVGLEENASEWTADHKREYNYLPDGEYVLKVWGRDHAGNVSGPVEIAFEVRPSPWRSWWAYLLYIVSAFSLFALVAFAAHRYRVKRLVEIERVRTRIATDLHDDIGASLSQISILSEVVRQRTAESDSRIAAPLARIAQTSRELIDSMSDIVWATNPKKDNLRDLVQRMRRFASDTLSARNIDFHFLAPNLDHDLKIDADLRRQIFLVFKESVNNTVKHSDCTEAEIELQIEGGWVILKLSDNGKGFDASVESDGHGLMSMRQRAESLGAFFSLTSEEGKGTTVILRAQHHRRPRLKDAMKGNSHSPQ